MFNPGINNHTLIRCDMKLLIHSQISTTAELKFGNG